MPPFWRSSLRRLATGLLALAAMLPAHAQTVTIYATETSGSQSEFADVLAGMLRRSLPTAEVRVADRIDDAAAGAALIIAVGTAAQQAVGARAAHAPVLAVLTPRVTFERIFGSATRATALYLDQPEDRQLALITRLPGKVGSVGVVASGSSLLSLPRLRLAAQRSRLTLVEVPVATDADPAPAIREATAHSEVLLAHPDPVVFSPQTIHNILRTSYRAKVPLIGFSPAYTRAGALVSLHASVSQLATQAADMARQTLATGKLPPPQYPREFEVSVNRQVARSLNIELPGEHELVKWLRQREVTR